ncbi:hypothetical protein BDZ91DRAFT_729065 [Kalaharituber pfeilii]|nr:hypothetical protein BDZ91DRAFT_729065 [Kalaharituber pfeilii]
MASPLCPGGGFLNGATAQEESLCMRNKGCVYTPDICVFRGRYGQDQANEESHHQPHPADKVNPPKEWWYVDVITSAALRQPEVLSDVSRYAKDQDREIMREGMRLVLRAAMLGGCRKIVLGAWGCGAYGNPVQEVAQLWKRVLLGRGGHGKTEFAEWFEQVVFAIVGGPSKNLRVFNETFAAV